MQAILLSSEEVAKCAYRVYEGGIRQKVETADNIGKMVIINVETGDYENPFKNSRVEQDSGASNGSKLNR